MPGEVPLYMHLNHCVVLLNFKLMKNSLYVIAGLLLVIWGILFWGLHAVGAVHFLLVGAFFIILVRLVFSKQLEVR